MAGRLNLSVTGIEDVQLTEQPEMSYFLTRFKRHTNFAFEINENQFDGVNDYGNLITCKIPNFHGDLIKNLTFKLARKPLAPAGSSWSPSFMTRLVEFAELYIGGQLIEKITGEYIYLYQQLRNNDYDTRQTLYFLTGHGDLLDYYEDEYVYFLDLPFHFYRNPKLSIPICALTKQIVEVRIKLRNFDEVVLDTSSYGGEISRLSLNVEYVYLNPEERAYLMSTEINHPITQVQLAQFKMKTGELKKDVLLNFKHPVREMYFVSQSNVSSESNFTNQYNKIKSLELKVNNETLFSKEGKEVGYDHTLERYINSPIASEFGGPIEIDERKFGPSVFGIHSFALHPTESGSSGYINMSRIIHKLLSLEIEPLSDINTNTILTQVDTENSSIPYTLTTETQVPFTDVETVTTETITTTPVTVTKNVTTKKERVDTTTITNTTTRQVIGLASNEVSTVATSPVTSAIRTKNEPVITEIVSEDDGEPTTTTSSQSSTITTRGSSVSTSTFAFAFEEKSVNSTPSVSFSNTFTRTGTVAFRPTSTESVFTDVPNTPPTTTNPTRVLGNPDELLRSSTTLPIGDNTLSTASGTLTNIDDTENVSESSGLTNPGSDKIFTLGNPSDTAGVSSTLIGVTITTSGGNTATSTGGGGSFPPGYIIPSFWYKVYAPTIITIDDVSDYSFDLETEKQKYGNICHISKDGSRIITTHGSKAQVPIHIYRYISEVTVDNTTLTNIFGKEYIKSYNNSTTSDDVRYLDFSFNQNTTNLDGSVCAASYYRLNGSYSNVKDLSGLEVTGTGVKGGNVNIGYDAQRVPSELMAFPSYDGSENVGSINFRGVLSVDEYGFFTTIYDTRAPSYPSSYTSPYDFYNGWSWSAFVLEDYRRAEGENFSGNSRVKLADPTFFHGWKWYSRHDNKLWQYDGAGTWTELTIPDNYDETTRIYTSTPFNLNSGPNETHINVMRYTESFEADSIGNGDWSTIEQLYQPSNTPNMHFGHSMSMDSLGNRLAVSGVVFPDIQTTNANIVVIYDYTNSSWTSTTIQLPTQTGNYGVQVALTGDGNTLCVSMHGNDTGTINCDGRLFLYTYRNNLWSLSEELDLPTPEPSNPSNSMFGRSIAISDDAEKIIVGAPNWDNGCAFLYHLPTGNIYKIEANTSGVTKFGNRVDISSDGQKIIVCGRTGGVEIWSHEDATDTPYFESYENHNGSNQLTDVSINQDGSKFVYSSQDSERIYVNDIRVTSTEISFSSGDIFTEETVETTTTNNGTTRTETNIVQTLPSYKVPIEQVSFDEIETVETITPFDSVQEVQEQKERVENVVTTRDITTTGTENTTTTEVGIRNQTDTTTTKSLTTAPVVVDQEHDVRVYAVNYNILSVRDGLAGLRF